MMVWKMTFLFQGCILRFHVNLQGCMCPLQFFETLNPWTLHQLGTLQGPKKPRKNAIGIPSQTIQSPKLRHICLTEWQHTRSEESPRSSQPASLEKLPKKLLLKSLNFEKHHLLKVTLRQQNGVSNNWFQFAHRIQHLPFQQDVVCVHHSAPWLFDLWNTRYQIAVAINAYCNLLIVCKWPGVKKHISL